MKGKVFPVPTMYAYRGSRGIAPFIRNLDARRGECSASLPGRFTPGKEYRCPLNRKLGGHRSCLVVLKRLKLSCLCRNLVTVLTALSGLLLLVQNVMAHAQKPDFVFPRNGLVHSNRWGRQFSRLLAAEVCASAWVMVDIPRSEVAWKYWLHTPFASFPFTSPPVRHRVPPGSERALPTAMPPVSYGHYWRCALLIKNLYMRHTAYYSISFQRNDNPMRCS